MMECTVKGQIVSEPRQWRSGGGQANLSFWLCDEDSLGERPWFQSRYKITTSGYFAEVMFTELDRGQFVQVEGSCSLDKVPGKNGKLKAALCVYASRIVVLADGRGSDGESNFYEQAESEIAGNERL